MSADKRNLPSDDEVGLAVEVLRMLADETRLLLLWCLLEDESSVGDLAQAVDKPASSVSRHLAKLRLARLVQTRRQGTTIFYRLESEHARQLVLDAIHHAEHQGTGVPAHHRRDRGVRSITSTDQA